MSVNLFPGVVSVIKTGGTAVTAAYGPVVGGIISNPLLPGDQGIASPEPLYFSLVSSADLSENTTTQMLNPGESFNIPIGQTTNVSVNAATSGHKFSIVVFQSPAPFTPSTASFPPSGPVTVQNIIPSYLYQQYSDDDDLQAFIGAYNSLAQGYLNWFNQIGLPIYTGAAIAGGLLNWVGQGLYGIARPYLPSGTNQNIGPLNTWVLNYIPLNDLKKVGNQNYYATTDDVYKRCITWAFYKGDGKVFNVRWLKRRIAQFLNGANGVAFNVDDTYQVSVTFGVGAQVNIRILSGIRVVTTASLLNTFTLNSMGLNIINSTFTSYSQFAMAPILKAAIDSGALELPFQFTYVVTV